MEYKFFIRDGNVYKMKHQKTYAFTIIGVLLAIGCALYFSKVLILPSVFLGFAILSAINIFSKKLEIDLNEKEISYRPVFVFPTRTISIDRIQNFEIYSMFYLFFRVNAALNVWYINKNGKRKRIRICQSITLKEMKGVVSEIHDILYNANN